MPTGYAIPQDLKEQAKALYVQGLMTGDIEDATGVPHGTLRSWIKRGKWGALRNTTQLVSGPAKERAVSRSLSFLQTTVQLSSKPPNGVSGRLRGVVSRELEAQVAVLEQNPPESLLELKNTPDREGRASMVKRIAETAALVEGWEDQKASGIVVMMESTQPQDINAGATVEMLPDDSAAEAIRALQED